MKVVAAYASGTRQELALEAEVCVVGSGAGGAVTACELAAAGFDVLLVEQGAHHESSSFSARPFEMMKTLYADLGMSAALGRPGVALPYGRCLGGTTVVNSGTCFRTPDRVLIDWQKRLEVPISPAEMRPIFQRVEEAIHVAPAEHAAQDRAGLLAQARHGHDRR